MSDEGKQKLRYWCDELRKLIDQDYPPFLMALTLAQLHHGAIAYIGKMYLDELDRRLIADAKQRAGLCNSSGCNNSIAITLTHHPHCELCDAKLETVCDEFDRLVDEGDE